MNTTATQKPFLKGLIESTSIPESLVRAVVRQMGGWKSFKESAPDIVRGGIIGGFHGFTYYDDTIKFAKANKEAIRSLAIQQAEDFGLGVVEMIKGFGCFKNNEVAEAEIINGLAGIAHPMDTNVLNALAWYAGEEVSRAFCDAFDPQYFSRIFSTSCLYSEPMKTRQATKKSPRLTRQDLELIAQALNHLKNFHREVKDRDLKTYNDIEADNIIDLALKLDLDGNYFDYEGRNEE